MSHKGAKPVFGGGGIGYDPRFTDDDVLKIWDLLEAGSCDEIDSARVYGVSEERIGKAKGGERFIVDTKTPGGLAKGQSTASGILEHIEESLKKTGAKQFGIFYIHAPDPSIPLAEQLEGINAAYQKGYFKRFGVSNFSAKQVQQVYDHCKAQGYPLPTVYQGNYNAAARLQETQIIPTLRKLNMAFYAYSPMAGGFLTKTAQQIRDGGADAGRFAKDGPLTEMYNAFYGKESFLHGLDTWEKAANAAGCGKGELAYRWIAFDSALDPSFGDGVVFGARNLSQIEETLSWWKKGSVGPEAKALIDEMWDRIKDDATLNNIKDDGSFAHK